MVVMVVLVVVCVCVRVCVCCQTSRRPGLEPQKLLEPRSTVLGALLSMTPKIKSKALSSIPEAAHTCPAPSQPRIAAGVRPQMSDRASMLLGRGGTLFIWVWLLYREAPHTLQHSGLLPAPVLRSLCCQIRAGELDPKTWTCLSCTLGCTPKPNAGLNACVPHIHGNQEGPPQKCPEQSGAF